MMYVYWLRAEQAPGRLVGSLARCTPVTRHERPGSRLRKQHCTGVRHTTACGLLGRLVAHGVILPRTPTGEAKPPKLGLLQPGATAASQVCPRALNDARVCMDEGLRTREAEKPAPLR